MEGEEQKKVNIYDGKVNVALQKKIPSNSEAAIILEGVVGFQDNPFAIFVKLQNALSLGDLPEVDIPTKYLFFYTGPPGEGKAELYADMGVALATAFTNKEFAVDVHAAETPDDVREALDEYMSGLKILPKDWNTDYKLDPPTNVNKKIMDELEEEIDEDRRYISARFFANPHNSRVSFYQREQCSRGSTFCFVTSRRVDIRISRRFASRLYICVDLRRVDFCRVVTCDSSANQ
jgi:hypothetical protein